MIRGTLIVIEGVDGAGTTTQATLLREKFVAQGLPALATAQPSKGPLGSTIRQILSGRIVTVGSKPPGWATMALLFAADRQDQQENEIEPNLREGVNVVCDRYVPSSVIYQSLSARDEKTVDWIQEINKHITAPDLVIYLQITPEEAARRRTGRGGQEEIFDNASFQEQLIQGYDRLKELFPALNIQTIDASLSPAEIADRAWQLVEQIRKSGD